VCQKGRLSRRERAQEKEERVARSSVTIEKAPESETGQQKALTDSNQAAPDGKKGQPRHPRLARERSRRPLPRQGGHLTVQPSSFRVVLVAHQQEATPTTTKSMCVLIFQG
jgi:hypothetical protein